MQASLLFGLSGGCEVGIGAENTLNHPVSHVFGRRLPTQIRRQHAGGEGVLDRGHRDGKIGTGTYVPIFTLVGSGTPSVSALTNRVVV